MKIKNFNDNTLAPTETHWVQANEDEVKSKSYCWYNYKFKDIWHVSWVFRIVPN